MMARQSHLAEFSSSAANPAVVTAALGFGHGHGHGHGHELLALQDSIEMRGFFHRGLSADASAVAAAAPMSAWQVDDAALRSLLLPVQLVGPGDHQHGRIGLHPSAHGSCVQPFQLRSCKYLGPTKELLNEFCSLGAMNSKKKRAIASKWEEVEASNSCSNNNSWPSNMMNPSLTSMDMLDLERRKARLLSMVEEVDRRYRRYREQMRSVELSFEAMAGSGAARVYSELALQAMSRHFRCLRDAIVGQIRATRKAMGEKDATAAVPGTTKGETPRLRLLDQCLRQQRAFQPAGAATESFPWRPQRGLPERSVSILRAWLFEHFLHPYPSDVDKHILSRQTGLSRSQVSNWFINARVRLWKPMIEDMYMEEMKQQDQEGQPSHASASAAAENPNPSNPAGTSSHDQKHQLLPQNSSSLISSIVDAAGDNVGDAFCRYTSLAGGGGAVSLTLGLRQHSGAAGAALSSFAAPAQQQSFLSSREEAGDAQPVHFGVMDGEEVALPYRDLMGSQLLHDLAG